jgi:hypothetical protein
VGLLLSPPHCKGATSCFSDKNHLPKETKKRKRRGKKNRFDHSTLFFRLFLFLSALPVLVAAAGRPKQAAVQESRGAGMTGGKQPRRTAIVLDVPGRARLGGRDSSHGTGSPRGKMPCGDPCFRKGSLPPPGAGHDLQGACAALFAERAFPLASRSQMHLGDFVARPKAQVSIRSSLSD